MEYAVNELGEPVIYIVNYYYSDQSGTDSHFVKAAPTLELAEQIRRTDDCHEIIEQNMLTGETCPLRVITRQQKEKEALVNLYKTGFKRQAFEGLDVRKPFQKQLNFPLEPELAKTR